MIKVMNIVHNFIKDIDWSDPSKIEVVLSGFIPMIKNTLGEKLRQLGFKVDDHWTSTSRILVTDRVSVSKKYFCAAAGCYPIVQSDWVKKSAEAGKILDPEPFLLPALKGLSICVSQLNKGERNKIQKLATENGASYSPALHGSITHLIIEKPEGDKFEFAKKLRRSQQKKDSQIVIVNRDWFYESLKQGYAQSPFDYQFTELDDDLASLSSYSSQRQVMETQKPAMSQVRQTQSSQPTESNSQPEIMFESTFLDSCHIFLFGFSDAALKEAHGYIAQSGAHLVPLLRSHSLTHVVLADPTKTISSTMHGVHIVTYDWLIDSCRALRREHEYKYYPVPALTSYKPNEERKITEARTVTMQHKVIEIRSEELPQKQSPPKVSVQQNSKHEDSFNIEAEIPQMDFSSLAKSNGTTPKVKAEHSAHENTSDKKISHEDSSILYDIGTPSQALFLTGYSLYIHSDHKDASVHHPRSLIQNNGGKLVDRERDADFIICNAIHQDMVNPKMKGKYATIFWLKACIKKQVVEDIDSHPLFPTIVLKEADTSYLKSKNKVSTRFSSVDTKEYGYNFVKNVVENLGGVFEDLLNKDVDYLICGKPESEATKKYQYTLRPNTNVDALSVDYIYQSANAGHFLDPSKFPFKEQKEVKHTPVASTSTSNSLNMDTRDAFELLNSNTVQPEISNNNNNNQNKDQGTLDRIPVGKEEIEVKTKTETMKQAAKMISPSKTSKKLIIGKPVIHAIDEEDDDEEDEDNGDDEDNGEALTKNDSPNSFGSIVQELLENSDKAAPLFTQVKTQHYPSQEESDDSYRITRTSIETGQAFGAAKTIQKHQSIYLETSYSSETERDRAYNDMLRLRKEKSTEVHTVQPEFPALSTLADESQVVRYDINNESRIKSPEPEEKKVFIVSGQQKTQIQDLITRLGGEVVQNYDKSCTHLVIDKLSKTEKFLAAVAAQLHIVHPSYVEESVKVGRWLPENDFLFASQSGSDRFGASPELCAIIRRQCTPGGKGKVFSSWIVQLVLDEKTSDSFTRIFLAGDAIVLNYLPKSQQRDKVPSHIIYGKNTSYEERKELWDKYHDKLDTTLVVSYEYVAKYLLDKQTSYEPFQLRNPDTKEQPGAARGKKRKAEENSEEASENSNDSAIKRRRRKA